MSASPTRRGSAPGEGSVVPSLLDRHWRLALFTGLYLYQGLVAGFATTALANHFAATGFAAADVGRHLAFVGLPWVLQPLLWGPLIDGAAPRQMGARRFWLVVSLAGAQACLGALALLGERPGLSVVSGVLFLHSLFASLADTATDRMLTGSVPEAELGRTGACTRAGFVGGSAVGAAGAGWLLGGAGFVAAVLVLLGVTTAIVLASALVREAPGDALIAPGRCVADAAADGGVTLDPSGPIARLVGRLGPTLQLFRRREAALLLVTCFVIDFALALFEVPFAVALVQVHGWTAAALTNTQAWLGLLGGTVGAAAVGFVVDRLGPDRALVGLLLACAAAFAASAGLVAASEADTGALVLGLSGIVPGLLYVVLLPAVVLASRAQGASATGFQIFMAAMNLGDVAGAASAGALEPWLRPAETAGAVALVFLASAAVRVFQRRRSS